MDGRDGSGCVNLRGLLLIRSLSRCCLAPLLAYTMVSSSLLAYVAKELRNLIGLGGNES